MFIHMYSASVPMEIMSKFNLQVFYTLVCQFSNKIQLAVSRKGEKNASHKGEEVCSILNLARM